MKHPASTPEEFMVWFRTNYPGPDTIIHTPDWHAPKIYRAAMALSGHSELLEACKAAVSLLETHDCQKFAGYIIAKAAIAKAEAQ